MAKLTKAQVTDGMVFTLKSHEKGLAFSFETDEEMIFGSVRMNPPLGSELTIVKKPYTKNGATLVDFVMKGDPKSYTTWWGVFRNHTEYKSGTVSSKPKIEVTSAGPFYGFDVRIKDVEFHDYSDGIGFDELEVVMEFLGTFTGGKKITTKIINEIKQSAGFKEKAKELLYEVMDKNKKQIDASIACYDAKKASMYVGVGSIDTWYKAGNLEFRISLSDDFNQLKENIDCQLDAFIKSKSTNLRFVKE